MNLRQVTGYLQESQAVPVPGTPEYREWLELVDARDFLRASTTGDVPVYLGQQRFFLYSVIVSRQKLVGDYADDLLQWNFSPSPRWGYGRGRDNPAGVLRPQPFPPMDGGRSTVLDGGEPVLFLRRFEGYRDRPNYVELNQRFAHITGVHWVAGRSAYSKLDETGDFEDTVIVRNTDDLILCTVRRDALDFYLALTDGILVRVFDIPRSHGWEAFSGRDRTTRAYKDQDDGFFARHTIVARPDGAAWAAWLRGAQIIRPRTTEEDLADLLRGGKRRRQYATFIALDWKHRTVHECSSDPAQLGNYFVPSDLPYETSPAFFKPQVLSQYRQDPDKYTFEQRTLRCRGAWSLPYDVNDEGQVNAYLIDLSHLPYREQLHWKAFNEEPRTGISERAFTTDFKGEWDLAYDPLEALQECLERFPKATHHGRDVAIWAFPPGRETQRASRLAYVLTDSTKEWEDQILELAKVLVEGFSKGALRDEARHLGQYDPRADAQLGSLKLLRRNLEAKAVDPPAIDAIVPPLEELWKLRSSISAHSGGTVPEGDLKDHYRDLLGRCDRAMRTLAELIRAGVLDVVVLPAELAAVQGEGN